MTPALLHIISGSVALGCALWAGLLAMAEESPSVHQALAEAPTGPSEGVPLHRALHISRLALLFIGGMASGTAVGWWYRPPLESAGAFAIGVTLLFLVGEALPRMVAALLPRIAGGLTHTARRTLIPFSPLLGIVGAVERLLQKVIRVPVDPPTTLGDLQREMLVGVFSLRNTTVEEIMTPRIDVFFVEYGDTWQEIVEALRRSEHARIPVYRDSPDDVAGILHARDLMPAVSGTAPVPERWQDTIRPAEWVPEAKTVQAQLRDFERNRTNIAIVVDEFGGTSGIVTPEDIIEEIVGEIRDEYDVHETPPVEREDEDRFWVDGGVTLDDLSDEMGTRVENDEVSTVGGLIYMELGRVPSPGEELRIADYRVVVEQVKNRRIKRVYFEKSTVAGVEEVSGEIE